MLNNPYTDLLPYVRQDKDNFHGCKREAREPCALVRSERELLFYAQSGVGKTSLRNASVIPILEEECFVVLPVVRVGRGLSRGAVADVVASRNIEMSAGRIMAVRRRLVVATIMNHVPAQFTGHKKTRVNRVCFMRLFKHRRGWR